MLRPETVQTTFLPSTSPSLPASIAATAAAPLTSATTPARKSARVATRISSSVTVTTSSTNALTWLKHARPANGGARPCAIVLVLPPSGHHSALPLATESAIDCAPSGSTPTTRAFDPDSFTAAATPASSPPPPQQTTTTSASGASSSISRPQLACPRMMSTSSKGCTSTLCSCWMHSATASRSFSPGTLTTVAPIDSIITFRSSGALAGMKTLALYPVAWPRYETARPALPAESVTTPALRSCSTSDRCSL